MLKLYWGPGTCALASHIALEETGAKYETEKLNLAQGDQRKPEYLKVNPKSRVPALITERGILTETPAILVWIAQTYPQAKLAPADPFEFAVAQAFNSYLCATVHPAHAHGRRGARWSDDTAAHESMKAKVPQNMSDSFTLIENEMLKGPWVMGDAYSICDPYLFTISGWLESDGVDIAIFPKVHDHFKRMSERSAVKAVLAVHKGV
jgi:glutathione S-transferase